MRSLLAIVAAVLIVMPMCGRAAGYTGSGTIGMMQSAYGGWLLATNGPASNPDTCSNNYVLLLPSHPQYKELTAFLLAAYVASKPVNVYVDGCHSAGYKIFSFVFSTWN